MRQGRRLTAVTDAGREVITAIDRILAEISNLKAVGDEFAHHARGNLAVGVTHTQARYALPPVVTAFKKKFPDVKLKLLQGNPRQLAQMVLSGEADMAIATEALDEYPEFVTLPCYQWHHCVVVKTGPSACEGEAAHARGDREISDRHLRLDLRGPFGARSRVRGAQSLAGSRRSPRSTPT